MLTIFTFRIFKLLNFSADKLNSCPSDSTVNQSSLISFFYCVTTHSEPGKCKDKVHPSTSHEGPEGEWCRNIALLSFNLSARREWVVNATPRPLYPRERDPVPHCIVGWMKFGNFKRLNVIIVSLVELSLAGAKPVVFYDYGTS